MLARWCLVALVVAGASGTANALKPGKHAELAQDSCAAAGLPAEFCRRVATEDYDTDSREWDDLSAHAQIDDGQTPCQAADAAAGRLWRLGEDLHGELATIAASPSEDDVGTAAAALGRALHTLQDNCAHQGMPNPQHAWASVSDYCDNTALSPDIQPDAFTCARTESDAAMATVAAAIQRAGVADALGELACPEPPGAQPGDRGVCDDRFLPGPIDACSFMARAHDWDGIDHTWNNAIVTPALRAAFLAGLAGEPAPGPMCGGDETALTPAVHASMVDVSAGPASCITLEVFCLGKADGGGSGVNPFADDPAPTAGGCTAGGGTGLAMLVLVAGFASRRRNSRVARCASRG